MLECTNQKGDIDKNVSYGILRFTVYQEPKHHTHLVFLIFFFPHKTKEI